MTSEQRHRSRFVRGCALVAPMALVGDGLIRHLPVKTSPTVHRKRRARASGLTEAHAPRGSGAKAFSSFSVLYSRAKITER